MDLAVSASGRSNPDSGFIERPSGSASWPAASRCRATSAPGGPGGFTRSRSGRRPAPRPRGPVALAPSPASRLREGHPTQPDRRGAAPGAAQPRPRRETACAARTREKPTEMTSSVRPGHTPARMAWSILCVAVRPQGTQQDQASYMLAKVWLGGPADSGSMREGGLEGLGQRRLSPGGL